MRRFWIGTGVAVLGLALGSALVRADDGEEEKPVATHWWGRMWPGKTAKVEAGEKPEPKDKEPVKTGPSAREKAMALREKEKQNLQRRQAVCLKLLQIAAETGDLELNRRAEELDHRAWEIYLQRTASLPSAPGVASEPDALTDLDLTVPPTNKPGRGATGTGALTDATQKQALRKERP